MEKPTNFAELLAYLGEHPRVIQRHRGVLSRETFDRLEGGFMWFTDEDGQQHHLPINCGMVAAETGVTFHADGLHVTKFGVTIDYLYDTQETP